MKYKFFILIILACLVQLPMSAQQIMYYSIPPRQWNGSESGHPHLFTDKNGRTYLFYQGNPDNGKTWLITQEEVHWTNNTPQL